MRSLLHPIDGLQSTGSCQQPDDAVIRSQEQPAVASTAPAYESREHLDSSPFRVCRSHERANARLSSAMRSLLHPIDGLQSAGSCQQPDDAVICSQEQPAIASTAPAYESREHLDSIAISRVPIA